MTTLASTFRTARKPHRCMSCLRSIKQGERYYFWKGTSSDGIWDGIATLKECGECAVRYERYVRGE